ncbi:hypothetical protein C8Q76DRAFT_336775 [Earliella scabrosa]|nr:hypothetical protein C8Q76DRAFT_336775 [Earliella scabrosa]
MSFLGLTEETIRSLDAWRTSPYRLICSLGYCHHFKSFSYYGRRHARVHHAMEHSQEKHTIANPQAFIPAQHTAPRWYHILCGVSGAQCSASHLLLDLSGYSAGVECHEQVSSRSQVFGNGTGSYVSIFTGPGTAILVSRFLSHLQETGRRTLRVDLEHPLHISEGSAYSTPSFVRTVVPPSSRRKADSDSLREWEA